jgi:hypothetical protein
MKVFFFLVLAAIQGTFASQNKLLPFNERADDDFPTHPDKSCVGALNFHGKSFNLFVTGDFRAPSSDIQGKVAVGGDMYVKAYTIGSEELSDYFQDQCFVRGTCHWETGYIVGNLLCSEFDISDSFYNTVTLTTPSKFKNYSDNRVSA